MAVRIVQCRKSDDTQVLVEITEEAIRIAAVNHESLNADEIMGRIAYRFGIVREDARTVADTIVAIATYGIDSKAPSEVQIVDVLEEFEP